MNNDLSVVNDFELDCKRTVYRALANSAIFRAFVTLDQAESVRTQLEQPFDGQTEGQTIDLQNRLEEIEERAFKLRRIYNECSAVVAAIGGGQFWEPMDPDSVMSLSGTVPDKIDVDLAFLAEITGVSVDDLAKTQKQALIEQARKGQARVSRTGDIFRDFMGSDTQGTEYLEEALDFCNMDVRDIGVRALKKRLDAVLKSALTGNKSGLSDLIFYKDAITQLSK